MFRRISSWWDRIIGSRIQTFPDTRHVINEIHDVHSNSLSDPVYTLSEPPVPKKLKRKKSFRFNLYECCKKPKENNSFYRLYKD